MTTSFAQGFPNALRPSTRVTVRISWLLALIIAVCVLASPTRVSAKEKKVPRIVTGAVLDENDNGIAGATVALTDLQTGKKDAIYTKDGGLYQFSDLRANHDYEVQASYKGVSSEVRKASSFDTRNRIVLNLKIPSPTS